MLKLLAVPLVVLVAVAPVGHLAARPAIGSAIDNTLNHNLPFIQVSYGDAGDSYFENGDGIGHGNYSYNTWSSPLPDISFVYYDQMTTQQQVQANSDNGFQQLLGGLFGLAGDVVVGAAAAAATDAIAPAVIGAAEATTATKVTSAIAGTFGGTISNALGWASSFGSY